MVILVVFTLEIFANLKSASLFEFVFIAVYHSASFSVLLQHFVQLSIASRFGAGLQHNAKALLFERIRK